VIRRGILAGNTSRVEGRNAAWHVNLSPPGGNLPAAWILAEAKTSHRGLGSVLNSNPIGQPNASDPVAKHTGFDGDGGFARYFYV